LLEEEGVKFLVPDLKRENKPLTVLSN
jgi:hypothetical protein